MIDFLFVSKTNASKKATLRVDMVDGNIERFTVMWCDGVRGTEFEKNLPWKCGSVLSKTEITAWAEDNKASYQVYEYAGEEVTLLVEDDDDEEEEETDDDEGG